MRRILAARQEALRPKRQLPSKSVLARQGGGSDPFPAPSGASMVSAGGDRTIIGSVLALNGTVHDNGLPNPPGAVAVTWSKVPLFGFTLRSNA